MDVDQLIGMLSQAQYSIPVGDGVLLHPEALMGNGRWVQYKRRFSSTGDGDNGGGVHYEIGLMETGRYRDQVVVDLHVEHGTRPDILVQLREHLPSIGRLGARVLLDPGYAGAELIVHGAEYSRDWIRRSSFKTIFELITKDMSKLYQAVEPKLAELE